MAAPDGYKLITEGDASIVFPEGNQVFYNKAQIVNRDMSIAVLNAFVALREKEWTDKRKFLLFLVLSESLIMFVGEKKRQRQLKKAQAKDEIPENGILFLPVSGPCHS